LTFADIVEEIRFGDCGRSRVATDDRGEIACEGQHPNVVNWRCRPTAAIQQVKLGG